MRKNLPIAFLALLILTAGTCSAPKKQAQPETAPDLLKRFLTELANAPVQQLPIGDSTLLLFNPIYWHSLAMQKEDYQPSTYEIWLNDLYYQIDNEQYFEKEPKSIYPKELIIEIFRKKNEGLIDFSKITGIREYTAITWSRQYPDTVIILSNRLVSEKSELYSIVFKTDIDCNNCSYGMSLIAKAVLSVKNGQLVDTKLIGYRYGSDIQRDLRFYYFSDETLVVKNFTDDEIMTDFYNQEQYRVNADGKFIRYYIQCGDFRNEWERGWVQNYTREGRWEDTNARYIIDSEYAAGLPVGEWKYYLLEQECDDEGHIILSSRKKGRLCATEKYQNGELVERKDMEP